MTQNIEKETIYIATATKINNICSTETCKEWEKS